MHNLEKKFPSYFKDFVPPVTETSHSITVYRACATGKCDRESFLSTFEENGFQIKDEPYADIAGQYSVSTYENPKHVKRFAKMISHLNIPFVIAVGNTCKCCGSWQRTRERRVGCKSSHVDWWLYEGAFPHKHFQVIDDFVSYLEKNKQGVRHT